MRYIVKNPTRYDAIEMNGGPAHCVYFKDVLKFYLKHTKMTQKQFVDMVKAVSEPHGIRFTIYDVHDYLYREDSPKNDKLMSICTATNLPITFWTGHMELPE